VTSRSGDASVKIIADLSSKSIYQWRNEPDQWICYDFKRFMVRPTHYSLRAWEKRDDSWSLNDWIMEGSNDGKTWIEFDRREGNTEIEQMKGAKTFAISWLEEVRMMRLWQLKKNRVSGVNLALSGMEIFGTLIDRPGIRGGLIFKKALNHG
jgi:hypothetical protein